MTEDEQKNVQRDLLTLIRGELSAMIAVSLSTGRGEVEMTKRIRDSVLTRIERKLKL